MTIFGYGKTTKAIVEKFGNCQVYDDKFSAVTFDKKEMNFSHLRCSNPKVAN